MLGLRQQGFVSQAAVDKAKADLDAAQATQGQTTVGVGHATVRAPVSGIVAQRLTELGEMAVPGKPLLSIYEPGPAGHRSIPQYRLAQMRSVRQARSSFPNWEDGSTQPPSRVLPTADAATHVSPVRVGLPAGIADVVPGMHARAHFVIGRASKLTVPQTAVVRRGEVAAVYVQNEQGVLSLRQLRLGEAVGGRRGRSARRSAGRRACGSRPGKSGHPDQVRAAGQVARWAFPAASPVSSPARR
jgi:hypothetical protein